MWLVAAVGAGCLLVVFLSDAFETIVAARRAQRMPLTLLLRFLRLRDAFEDAPYVTAARASEPGGHDFEANGSCVTAATL